MSVATELFDPRYAPDHGERDHCAPPRRHLRAVPDHVRPAGTASSGAAAAATSTLAVLHPPRPESPPLRLTRRGVLALAALVAMLGALLVWVAALSAPSEAADSAGQRATTSSSAVTVRSGDTLWSIASRTAPGADPRAEVERLRALNHLGSVALVPGQQLRVH